MTSRKRVFLTTLVTALSTFALIGIAHDSGADPGMTAGPGEDPNGCAQATCHVGTNNPTKGSGVTVDFPDGSATYTPGTKQHWVVKVTGASTPGYGFQVSARLADNTQAGTFSNTSAKTQVVCQDGRANTTCRADAPLQYVTHTAPNDKDNTFEFDWTPPDTDKGAITVYLAGNAVNLNGQNTGDRVFLNTATLTPKAASSNPPQIRTANPTLQAFSSTAAMSPGTWIEIYGTNLSATTREWAGGDFTGNNAPTSLDGVKVTVDGKAAFVRYVSPTQINVQVPDGIGTGAGIQLVVENAAGRSTATVNATAVSPALLTTPLFNVGGKQYVAALKSDFRTFVGRANLIQGVAFAPAKPGETIIIFAVGCGPTSPASPAGQFFGDARPLSSPFQIKFGQTTAQAQGFLAAQAVGLCQFNVTVPEVADGDSSLDATVGGVANGQNLFVTVQR